MRQFLDVQQSVMTAAAGPLSTSEAMDEGGAYPFLHRIVARDADRLTAECDLDAGDEFLRQHVLYSMHVSDLDPALTALRSSRARQLEMIARRPPRLPAVVPGGWKGAHNWIAVDATESAAGGAIAAEEAARPSRPRSADSAGGPG